MNSIKSLALVGMATTALFATQAFATPCAPGTQGSPVCVATVGANGAESSLQDVFDGITSSPGDINVYTGQASPSSFWSISGSGASENAVVMEIAGNANSNSFGIFDPTDTGNYLELFGGPASTGWTSQLWNDGAGKFTAGQYDAGHNQVSLLDATFGAGNSFGYYLKAADGTFFFSDPTLNGGNAQMVAYAGDSSTSLTFDGHTGMFDAGEFLLAWEDMALQNSDKDYNDFVVVVESVNPVPEPGVLGMFGLGALLIGGFVGLRRRSLAA
ncbi:hypothetical protein ASD68_08745 [Rhodanobacter sp. Root627]|uniref:DUF4114 domain-containing protein n=1 Tax=Rhodanobacter sp. Root627 TaxID=1736572 RepID=UPI0006F7AEE5|nr:DUF4114 domain-containing protein [Rhodanobacter sp. Root627]KRA33125.1 hypothetical protein ASD68_08745 [Rhodanobacter sp. Root627]